LHGLFEHGRPGKRQNGKDHFLIQVSFFHAFSPTGKAISSTTVNGSRIKPKKWALKK
jgi:hypothetical protein